MFLDFVVYLVFFEKKFTLRYQLIANPPTRLGNFFKKIIFCLEQKVFMCYVLSVYKR